jgi:hypothetical protein
MKKYLIAAALVFTTGIVMSFSKTSSSKSSPVIAQTSGFTFKKDLGSGD